MQVEYSASADSGGTEITGPVFWANRNPGIRYVRCELPARHLGGHVEHLDSCVRDGRFERFVGPHVFQLPVTRYQLDRMIEAQTDGRLVAAEFDDDYTIWDEARAAIGWVKREVDTRDEFTPCVEVARAAARLADVTLVSTKHLAKQFDDAGARLTRICPNFVDPADWPEPQRADDAPFRALFAAAYNPHDFSQVREAMTWLAAQPDSEAIVIGGNVDWPDVIHIPWVANDLPAVRAFMTAVAPNVGLRPLEPTRFARSKSDLKVLEYAMCGALPIVAPYEPYKLWEGDVMFARNGHEFLAAVQWAHGNQDQVAERASRLRELVLDAGTSAVLYWRDALRLV